MLDNKSSNNISNSEIKNAIVKQYKDCIFINNIEDSEILNKIIKNMINNAKNDINVGNYVEVNDLLKEYMTSEGFDKLSKNLKIDIIYYRAITLLNMGKYNEAKVIAEQILSIDKKNLKYYKFGALSNILLVNRKDYNKYIDKLKELNETENELESYEIKMLYNEKNYDEIIKRYITNDSANEKLPKTDDCIGILISSLMIRNENILAKKVLKKIGLQTEYIIYLKAVTSLYEILNDKNNIMGMNRFEKKVLNENIKLLKSVKEYFDKNIIYRKLYYYYLLRSLIIQDPMLCVNEYEKLNDELKKDKELKIIYIDALILTNKIDLAEKIVSEDTNGAKEIEMLLRYVDILNIKKDYKRIVELLDGKKLDDLNDNGFLAVQYVQALMNEKGIEETEKVIDKEYLKIPLVNITIAEFLYKNKYSKKKILQYCDQAIQKVDLEDELIIEILADKLEKMLLFNKSMQLLEKSQMKYTKTKAIYIRNVIHNEKSSVSSITEALKMVEEIIKIEGKSDEILVYKGKLLRRKNRNEEALKCYEEAFDINNTYTSAYYCLSSKYESQDYYNIDKYINFLDSSDNLEHMIIIAAIYSKQKEFEKANKKIYNIIYNMRNEFSLDILAKIIFGIFLTDFNEYEWKEYDKVENNVIAVLNDENGISKKICIETDIKLKKEIEELYDVELYNYQSTMRNKLVLKKKDDIVTIKNKKYVIKNIVNKYEYFMFKIRDTFFENIPEKSKYCSIIKTNINDKDPLKNIMPFLQQRKNYTENVINTYRMKNNEVGLTISRLSKMFGSDECRTIKSLLNDKNGLYYTGEISNEVVEEYVVTISSLIVLKIFGMEQILVENKSKIHIAESTINKLNKYFLEKANDRHSASMGIGNDNKPYVIKNTEKNIENEIEFVREIIEVASQLKIEKNTYREDKLNLFSILDEEEQDSMCIAKNNNYTLIVDDLCLRKIYVYFSNGDKNNQSNSMEFMKYMTFTERIDTLDKISQTQYLYCITKDIILELILWSEDEQKIKSIISNLLETREKYKYNRKIIGEAVLELYKDRSIGKTKDRLMMIIKLIFSIDKDYR